MPLTTALAPLPTAADVLAYLTGEQPDATLSTEDLAKITARLTNVTSAARSYCRGLGFTVDSLVCEDIGQTIIGATAREVNVSPGVVREEIGAWSAYYGEGMSGFSLRELTVLNAYRRQAT